MFLKLQNKKNEIKHQSSNKRKLNTKENVTAKKTKEEVFDPHFQDAEKHDNQ